jgi:hypothetical protein
MLRPGIQGLATYSPAYSKVQVLGPCTSDQYKPVPPICYRRSVFMCVNDGRFAKPAVPSRRNISAPPPAQSVPAEGRGFNLTITRRATAHHHRSRCFTRAKLSGHNLPVRVTNRDSGARFTRDAGTLARNHIRWGGTVNRPCIRVSHRKQMFAHVQGRNFPVHFPFPIFRQNPIALALRSLGGRSLGSVIKNRGEATHPSRRFTRAKHSLAIPAIARSVRLNGCRAEDRGSAYKPKAAAVRTSGGRSLGSVINNRGGVTCLSRWFICAKYSVLSTSRHSLTTRHSCVLPGTVTRVETRLSHRKQTTGHASTRNVPAHGFFRQTFAVGIQKRPARQFTGVVGGNRPFRGAAGR